MSEEGDEKRPRSGSTEKPADDQDKDCEKILLNPKEWKDPSECKVISEFHKTPEGEEDIEAEDPDLEEWVAHWRKKPSYKVISEYHKEGAPNLGEAFGDLPEIPPEGKAPPPKKVELYGPKVPKDPEVIVERVPETGSRPKPPPKMRTEDEERPHLEKKLDVNTIEFLAFTVVRALLPRRVKYTIKEEGVIDMDVAIMDRDVVINTNTLLFEFPDLSIWRFIIAYKGKPVMEMGRGVKNRMKLYYGRTLRLLWDTWRSKRAREKARKKREKDLFAGAEVVELSAKKKGKKIRVKKRKGRGKKRP